MLSEGEGIDGFEQRWRRIRGRRPVPVSPPLQPAGHELAPVGGRPVGGCMRHRESKGQLVALFTAIPRLPEVADGLAPVDDLLDALVTALADGVARLPGGTAVDGRSTLLVDVLRDVGFDVAFAAAFDK